MSCLPPPLAHARRSAMHMPAAAALHRASSTCDAARGALLRAGRLPPALAMLWLALGCASPALAGAPEQPLAFSPHAFETRAHGTIAAEAAFLEVPRRHAEPDGPRIRLRVVRLPATGGGHRAAPVVYLAGGPGGSAIATAQGPRWPVFDQVRREADVLLLEQRGTALSEPPPACPHAQRFDDASPLQRDNALAALQATARRCVAYWRQAGVDLAAYTTAESADDIEALRRALGRPQISLWGMSYGTHLALASVRRHAAGIERVVLMGTEGPDDTLKAPLHADALLEDLASVARQQGFDDLVGSARHVLRTLRDRPGQGRSLMHRGRQVTIGEFDAQLAIAASLGRRSTQQLLPLALREAEHGDYDLLAAIVLMLREELGSVQAMPLAMDVASAQSPQRRALAETQARASLFGDALNFPFPTLGDGLGLVDLGEAFRAPLHSDVPVLMVSGTLDGRTPPDNARALLPGFSRGQLLLVHGASHDNELWLGHPQIAARVAGFLGGHAVDDAPLEVPPPAFATGKLQLLLSMLGIGTGGALAAAAVLVLLPAALWWAWRRRPWRRRRHVDPVA